VLVNRAGSSSRAENQPKRLPQARDEARPNSLNAGLSRPRWPTPARSATIAAPCSLARKRLGSERSSGTARGEPSRPTA
jgi:hypothetical protein